MDGLISQKDLERFDIYKEDIDLKDRRISYSEFLLALIDSDEILSEEKILGVL